MANPLEIPTDVLVEFMKLANKKKGRRTEALRSLITSWVILQRWMTRDPKLIEAVTKELLDVCAVLAEELKKAEIRAQARNN